MKVKTKIIQKVMVIFLLAVVVFSCEKDKENIKQFPSGNIKYIKNDSVDIYYYDRIGKMVFEKVFHKKKYDSVFYFYNNKRIFKAGKRDKAGNLFGKWKYYTKEGNLSDIKEFFIINNDYDKGYRLNQKWYFNKKGDTMFYGNSNFNVYNQKEFIEDPNEVKRSIFIYFDFHPEDTLSVGEPLRGFAQDAFPFWKKKGSECYVVIGKEHDNFNSDFSNEHEIKTDTFYCLEKDKFNKGHFPNADLKHSVVFGRWFDTPGEKIIRGYMIESYTRKATPGDSIVEQERRTYFEKRIYVKDTIKI